MRHFALLTLLLGGCSWVTPGDLDCQLQLVDDDGDGFPLNQVEDGYEGADRCSHLVAVDCDDDNADVHPEAEEAWYDGVDSDCALDDDYDQDLDGYVADEYQGLATEGVDGSGELPGGDCDDTAGSINPDGTDVWYDGVDSNCSGDDDYDQDADGYVADEYTGLATTYADGTGSLPGGDCDDTAADASPGVTDSWYDGVDSDCAGDDDYDQDVDGFQDAVSAKGGDDCDDLDPSSYPGAVESFSDIIDHDCDGGSQTFTLDDLDDLSWSGTQSLLFRATDSTVYLGVSAEELTHGSTDYYDSALALTFDAVDPSGGYDEAITWLRNYTDPHPKVLTPGTDLYPTDQWLYAGVGIETSSTRQLVLRAWELADGTTYATNPPITAPLSFDDITLAMDVSGNIHAVGCTEDDHEESMVYLWAEPATLLTNNYDDTFGLPTRASTCDLDFFAANGDGTLIASRLSTVAIPSSDTGDTGFGGPPVEVRDIAVYTFTHPATEVGPNFVEQASITGYQPSALQVYQDGFGRQLVIADLAANAVSVLALDAAYVPRVVFEHEFRFDPLLTASSAKGPDDMIYVFAATASGTSTLLYGLPDVMPSMQEIPFDLGIVAEHVAVWVDEAGSYLFLAASGYDVAAKSERVIYGYAEL